MSLKDIGLEQSPSRSTMGEGNTKRGYKVIRETEGKSIKDQHNQGSTTRQSNQPDTEMTVV